MRIISKHKDFYDGFVRSLNFGSDDPVVLVRNNRTVNEELGIEPYDFPFNSWNWVEIDTATHNLTFRLLWFCGTIYPFIRVVNNPYALYAPYTIRSEFFLWNEDDVNKFAPTCEVHTRRNGYFTGHNPETLLRRMVNHVNGYETHQYYKSHRETWEQVLESKGVDLKEYALKLRCPYFCVDSQIEAFPILENINFGKVMDVQTVFTKLERYLTNELQPRDEVNIPISDELHAHKKGFDKFSFRKQKETK